MGKLGQKLKKTVKNAATLNPVTKIKRDVKDVGGRVDKVSNYFDPKVVKPDAPTEIPDEEAIARRRNRDGIRRRQAGGRSSTIMSDALG